MIGQGTFEWYYERFGMITMSDRVDTIISGNVHQLNNLLDTIRWEKSIKEDVNHVRREWERQTAATHNVEPLAWGRKHESEAIMQFEMVYGHEVKIVGFHKHPIWPEFVGCSADFLTSIPRGGMDIVHVAEVKCPLDSDNHYRALRYGMDPKHFNQVQGNIECWQTLHGLFISYDPRVQPVDKQLYKQPVALDTVWQTRFRTRMQEFVTHYNNRTRFDFAMQSARDGIPSMF